MATATTTHTIRCPHCGTRNRVADAAAGVPRCGNCHKPLPWIVDATAETFDAVVDSTLLVLVDFWADWCGPCKMIAPIVERIAQQHAGRLKAVRLDIEAAREVAGRYGVQSIPLLVLMRNGREIDRQVGAVPEARLEQWLAPHLAAASPGDQSSGGATADGS
jgi:thioredoxin 2